ncbi:MaoC family dehydratase N-terminal domain-containing protein [Streptomyces abyssomicinicus]|uniref:MaoC family dehydratase N-terminal domain-containing protein n=1 Tax=Streptomyces abyssomicinicus TaxID=574929 RepID=UPI0012505417|nr:MaoC family dehydratase N-terminal domain-containing protein [Streptomyces abyssomicinicus]
MAIDKDLIGKRIPSHTVDIERGQLRFFAKAIGETDPVYTDPEAARAAGHRDLLMPPTYLFCADSRRSDGFDMAAFADIDVRHVLHAEQSFIYHRPVHAGDSLTFEGVVEDIVSKKGGALEFLVLLIEVLRDGEPVAEVRKSLAVRDPKAGK